ncbi:MAG: glycosyltransferase family 2 protein, partial [Bacteroidota bacterium]
LNQNIGRSKIRNLCASMANFHWIIFMDCDSKCPDDQYLKRYAQQTKKSAHVICGGRSYMDAPLENNTYLHWFYGTNREVRSAKQRNKEPFRSFMTNNFMLRKDVFDRIQFNEDLIGYGHEDTLFGIDLSQKQVPLLHIDNPLLHIGLQNDKEFLDKTRQAVFNLVFIYKHLNIKKLFERHVRLVSAFEKVRKARMTTVLAFLFPYFQSTIEKQLKSGKPRLWLLDMYKLGVFCQAYKYKREDQ